MSTEGPKPYPVVYDQSGALQYSFQDGYYNIPLGVSGITQLTGDVTAGPGSGSVAATIANGHITPAKISTSGTDNFTFPNNVHILNGLTVEGLILGLNYVNAGSIVTGGFSGALGGTTTTWPTSIDGTFYQHMGILFVTSGSTQTLPTSGPYVKDGMLFIVHNDSTSTGNLVVDGLTLVPNSAQMFQFSVTDANWDPVGSVFTGGVVTGVTEFQQPVTFDATIINLLATDVGPTFAPNAADTPNHTFTIAANSTIAGPASPPVDMTKCIYRIINDASHSVTLLTGSGNHRFSTDIPSYTNSVSKTDYVGVVWNAGANVWDVVSIIKGF